MMAYWAMFVLPLLSLLLSVGSFSRAVVNIGWWIVVFFMAVLIGLRHEVGGDWYAYLNYFELTKDAELLEVVFLNDPGYMALNWLVAGAGGNIYIVNTVVALIMVTGVVSIARGQPFPAMVLVAAVPYLLVVVAMGYTRQAAAIGLICHALVALERSRWIRSAIMLTLAVLFHKTAIVMFLLLLFAFRRSWYFGLMMLLPAGMVGVFLWIYFSTSFWGQVESYVVGEMESSGGWIRYSMAAIPCGLIILFRRRLFGGDGFAAVWVALSCFGILLFPAMIDFSTMADRFLLYVYPVILVFWGRFYLLWAPGVVRGFVVMASIYFHFMVLWVWLKFAVHAPFWIPYKMGI